MSTTKISDLPVLSSADAADEFVVVDDSAGVTKKITQGDLNVLVANADDYEEGTWTPTYVDDSGFSATAVSSHECFYTKIGNIVHIYGILATNGTDTNIVAGNQLTINGLPFLPKDLGDAVNYIGSGLLYESLGGETWGHLAALNETANPTRIIFEVVVSSNNPDADQSILFTCTYRVN